MDQLAPAWPEETSSRALLRAVHAGFILTGIVTTLLGPVLPLFAVRWTLNDAQAGALFLMQFAGATLAAIFVGTFLPHRGFRFSLAMGFALMCIGIGGLALGSESSASLALFSAGAGQGVAITVSNLFVAEANPRRPAAALSLLNFSWGVGAVAWPLLVALGVRLGQLSALLLALSAALGLITLWMVRLPLAASPQKRNLAGIPLSARSVRLDVPSLVFFGAMFFLYVGVEGSIGGWVASDMRRLTPSTAEMWVLPASFFWGSLMAGRALAPLVLRWLLEQTLLFIELLLATFGLALLYLSTASATVIVGASLAGLGLSGVFPILISFLKRRLGDSSSRFAGLHFALGGVGGAALPWLVGVVSATSGSLNTGLLVPLFGWLCLGVLSIFRPRSSSQPFSHAGASDSAKRPG